MAQSRNSGKGTKRKSSTSNTNSTKRRTTSASRRSGSRSNAKRKYTAAKTAKNAAAAAGGSQTRQVNAILLFAAALFLLFVAVIPGGNVWAALQSVLFGIFGVISYVIPLLLIYVAVVTSLDRDIVNMRAKVIETIVLIVLVCAAVDIFGGSGPNSHYGEAIRLAYVNGKTGHTGGAAGAILGDALMILFASKTAAGITDLILIFVFILLISGTTLARFFTGLWKPVKKASDATSVHFEERARQNEIRRQMREQARLANQNSNFTDVPLGPAPRSSKKAGDDPISETELAMVNGTLPKKKHRERRKKNTAAAPRNPRMANIYAFQTPDGFDGGSLPAADSSSVSHRKKGKKQQPAEEKPAPNAESTASSPDVRLDDIIRRASHRSVPEPGIEPNSGITADAQTQKNRAPTPMTPEEKAEAKRAADETEREAAAAAAESGTSEKPYQLPPIDCLNPPKISLGGTSEQELRENAEKLVQVLQNFGVKTSIVDIERGPSVTRYELAPAPGVKISRITNLSDDIALNLAASGVRIEAPIPNKAAVGIEVPNKKRETVTLREVIDSGTYRKNSGKSKLNVALGRDIAGNICTTDLAKMPHLLIAGTTGSGKSVCLNSMILSILYNASPEEVKLVMIDPKKVEFSVYNGIPHLLIPVVSDPHKAAGALSWAVKEMLNRYKTFSENNVRDIRGYNEMCKNNPDKKKMPSIVIFIDELADLMMATPAEVEDSICRLAQMARAAGMHLVIATQRPSVDVITGLIKANIPSRLSLSVSSAVDSRTILDMAGAEKLLGNGDMLFNPIGNSKPVRIQGCYTSDSEVEKVVQFIKSEEESSYSEEILEQIEKEAAAAENSGKKSSGGSGGGDDSDPLIPDAIQTVVEAGQASTTLIQRKLRVGYAHAARIVDELEERGIIGPFEGSKPRKVLITKQQWLEMNAMSSDGEDDGTAAAIDMGIDSSSGNE